MATVRDLLTVKGSQVLSIGPQATALDAAVLMNDHKIGSLVVLDAGRVCGIITERDILRRIVAAQRDPGQTPVRDVMTADVICCLLHTSLEEVRGVLKNRRIRHLPVLDANAGLCGLISIGDLNAHETSSQEMTIHMLRAYIAGHV